MKNLSILRAALTLLTAGLCLLGLTAGAQVASVQLNDCALNTVDIFPNGRVQAVSIRISLPSDAFSKVNIDPSTLGSLAKWSLIQSTDHGEAIFPASGARFVYFDGLRSSCIRFAVLIFEVPPAIQGKSVALRLVASKIGGESVVLSFADVQKRILSISIPTWKYFGAPSVNLAPAYAQIEKGTKQWVLHAPLSFSIANVLAQPTTWPISFNLTGAPSTQSWDESAGFVAAFEQHFTAIAKNTYYHFDWSLGYHGNEAFTSRQTNASLGIRMPLQWLDVDRSSVRSIVPATATITPVSLTYRNRIDPILSPSHVSAWTINPSLLVSTPTYYFIRKSSTDFQNASRIFASAQVWWFPADSAAAGAVTHHFEGRADLHFQFPIKHPILSLGQTCLDLGLGYGADPTQGFSSAPVISLTLFAFGAHPTIVKWP